MAASPGSISPVSSDDEAYPRPVQATDDVNKAEKSTYNQQRKFFNTSKMPNCDKFLFHSSSL